MKRGCDGAIIEVRGTKGGLYATVSHVGFRICSASGALFGTLRRAKGSSCTLLDATSNPILLLRTCRRGLGRRFSLSMATVPEGHVFATAERRDGGGIPPKEHLEVSMKPNVD